ncbi:hypothetical protein CEXT_614741 [Caerostris extrusa]|uniref:Uncharacterized protein n=1 Tax=Caerostris extrusa TaxID=172846 RepID=A0AAV4PCY2_CAEEX|nr:hypothetical protein CEXT_614741 [Caerostris extrusa]
MCTVMIDESINCWFQNVDTSSSGWKCWFVVTASLRSNADQSQMESHLGKALLILGENIAVDKTAIGLDEMAIKDYR